MSEMMTTNTLVKIKEAPPYSIGLETPVLLNSLARASPDKKTGVRNLLMVPSGTRRLKATAQEVSVNEDGEEKGGVERSDEKESCNVEDVEKVNDGQHEV
jgi:hypothetical protein